MSPIERLWKDKLNLYRWESLTADNITKSKKVLKDTDVKCHYSKRSLSNAGEDIPTLNNSYSLFCGVDIDIKEGDEVIVTQRNGRQVTLSVGEIFPYSNHQEAIVKRSDTA